MRITANEKVYSQRIRDNVRKAPCTLALAGRLQGLLLHSESTER